MYGYYEEGFAVDLKTLNQWPILEAFFELCRTRTRSFTIEFLSEMLETIEGNAKFGKRELIPEEVYCVKQCKEILESEEVRREIEEHVSKGEWLHCGASIGILNDDIILEAIRKNPKENASCVEYLTEFDSKKEALDIFLTDPVRDKLFSNNEMMLVTAMPILQLIRKTDMFDEQYLEKIIDMDEFIFSMMAAHLVLRASERGISLSKNLVQKAEECMNEN